MGTAEIAPCPVILVIQEKQGEKLPSQLLFYFVLLQLAGAGPSPAIPSLERAASAELRSIPTEDATARTCCTAEVFTYLVSLSVVCSPGQLAAAFI